MLQLSLALVCDFYYPSIGGVEVHIFQLARLLSPCVKRLIIITHSYAGFSGLHNYGNFSVYYLCLPYNASLNFVWPTFVFSFPQARRILLSEGINIVHTHQTASSLSLQYGLYAKILGLKVIHTEHSLYGFNTIFDIHLNAFIGILLPHYEHLIAVSRTTRNNLILRSKIKANKTTVIPNGVHITKSMNQAQHNSKYVRGIFVGRLTYRRGIDLLIQILPSLCSRNPCFHIDIIGDGPKMNALKAAISLFRIEDRVTLHGAIKNQNVLQIMQKCDIFINTPIIQSFGIALVEAAALGLYCVSTDVGGINEILPQSILDAVKPNKSTLISAIQKNIKKVKAGERMKIVHIVGYYSWENCCARTMEVYENIYHMQNKTPFQFIRNIIQQGKIMHCLFSILVIFLLITNWLMDMLTSIQNYQVQQELHTD